ncbi:MAG TPA: PIN domain-containing protein [Solirubrobacteraceae bacterium]|nr:PIN domain-containing protein [Solirubrobacteraceae bacterium]
MGVLTRGLTLDTGALIAFERGDDRMRRLADAGRNGQRELSIPVVVIAEAWRGGNRRALQPLLDVSAVEEVDDELARRAGELLARTGRANAVDAIVAVSAARRGDTVVTSDPGDLLPFADDLRTIRVWSV